MRKQQNKVLLYWMIYISTILFYTLYNLSHTNNLSLVEDIVTLKNNFYSWDGHTIFLSSLHIDI